MYPGSERLHFPCYRCHRCHRLITKLEILDRWHEAEKDTSVVHHAICPCGSRHLSPTNPKWWEELLYPRVWRLWYYEVLLPWLAR